MQKLGRKKAQEAQKYELQLLPRPPVFLCGLAASLLAHCEFA
jgi:hypothetical protein